MGEGQQMKTYLVTGGCGFIGSHLCDALINLGHHVIVLDNLSFGEKNNVAKDAELIIGDIRDSTLVNKIMRNVDGCFHLAAISSVELCNTDWIDTHEINMNGTITIFNAAAQIKEKRIPIVYASSSAIYGDNINTPLIESATPMPLSTYAADKIGCEFQARAASLIHNLSNIGLRLFNIYGPKQDPNNPYSGVITKFLDHLRHNESLEIHGDGHQTRDFVYVIDAVRFFLASMQKLEQQHNTEYHVYNVCTDKATTIEQLALVLEELTHKHVKILYTQPRKGDVPNSLGCPEKAFRELGIKADYSLSHGLKELINFLHQDH